RTAWSNHSWSEIFISFSLQNRLKMRIIVSGYFLRDVFVKRGNRFLPRKGFLIFYYNPVCKEKRACSKSRHTLIILLIHLFLLSAFFFQSQTFIKCCSTFFNQISLKSYSMPQRIWLLSFPK